MHEPLKPKWRNGAGMALILLLIALWSMAVVSLAPYVAEMPFVVELAFFVAAGLAWIFPLRPLLIWMETGRWRRTEP